MLLTKTPTSTFLSELNCEDKKARLPSEAFLSINLYALLSILISSLTYGHFFLTTKLILLSMMYCFQV
jgi:hypothetical protein